MCLLLLLLPAIKQEMITEMIKINPNYKPPADYRPEKKYRKLRIPMDEYPGYNFIGLIIGPRGNTQKRMERVRKQRTCAAFACFFAAHSIGPWGNLFLSPSVCYAVLPLQVLKI